MLKEHIFLCINAILYIITLISFIRYKKTVRNMGVFLFALYTMSAIGSVWYYSYPKVPLYYPQITAAPLIYLYLCIVVCVAPFLQTNLNQISGLDDSNIRKYLNGASIFFSIICIVPFFELILKMSSINLGGTFFSQMYDSGEDNAVFLFSSVGKKFFSPLRHLADFVVLLFFYQLSKVNVRKGVLLGMFLAVLTIVLFKLMSGSRGGIFGVFFLVVFYFSFFKNFMPEKRRKIISKCFLIGSISLFLGVGIISISRFNDSVSRKKEQSIDLWISQYAGESYIRFANTIWFMDESAEGNQNFAIIKDALGMYNFKSYNQYLYQEGNRIKVALNVFYTFVGDFYIDLGRYGTVIFILLLLLFELKITKISKGRMNILQLYVLGILFSLLSYGFCANVYRGIYVQKNIVLPLILVFILFVLQKHPLRKQ